MRSQGMQENQQVVFMSDGGENVRRVQEYLHPFSEHLIDWFHITMRLTVLQQQTKVLQEERPETGAEVSKRLESVKHRLWHGNTEEALERMGDLLMELSLIQDLHRRLAKHRRCASCSRKAQARAESLAAYLSDALRYVAFFTIIKESVRKNARIVLDRDPDRAVPDRNIGSAPTLPKLRPSLR